MNIERNVNEKVNPKLLDAAERRVASGWIAELQQSNPLLAKLDLKLVDTDSFGARSSRKVVGLKVNNGDVYTIDMGGVWGAPAQAGIEAWKQEFIDGVMHSVAWNERKDAETIRQAELAQWMTQHYPSQPEVPVNGRP